ncbi:type IV pilus biogenesis protein PilM [Pseudomonas cremoricolorata]|uniref:type IV pilus biogenesis protein PilM n=1 Tax=Pseudomonas cremoricolorata TaxID=157783 RepID=UPI0004228110|nr:pilus assembly protein PilM [Pseudomonas cremoricolorata]
MLGRIGRDASSPLAVEIAADSIRIVQLNRRRGRPRISAWAVEMLERSTPLPGLCQPLRRAVQRCASRQRKVVLALPAAQVICKTCALPAGLVDTQLEQQLLRQAEQLLPFPLDDLALDFQVLGPAAQPGQVEVLVAACRQSLIDPYEQLCAEAGLQLVGIEVDSFALLRLLRGGAAEGAALLQVEANEVLLHRWGARHLALQQRAPELPGSDPLACVDWLRGLWQEASALGPPTQLSLTGARASEALAQVLSAQLGLACAVWTPLESMQPGAPIDEQLRSQVGRLALAHGLALGGLR